MERTGAVMAQSPVSCAQKVGIHYACVAVRRNLRYRVISGDDSTPSRPKGRALAGVQTPTRALGRRGRRVIGAPRWCRPLRTPPDAARVFPEAGRSFSAIRLRWFVRVRGDGSMPG